MSQSDDDVHPEDVADLRARVYDRLEQMLSDRMVAVKIKINSMRKKLAAAHKTRDDATMRAAEADQQDYAWQAAEWQAMQQRLGLPSSPFVMQHRGSVYRFAEREMREADRTITSLRNALIIAGRQLFVARLNMNYFTQNPDAAVDSEIEKMAAAEDVDDTEDVEDVEDA